MEPLLGTRNLQCFPLKSRSPRAARARFWQSVAGGRNLQFRPAELRPLVLLPERRHRPGALLHVPPAQYARHIYRQGRTERCLVRARIGLYEPRGEYQLIIDHMEDAGLGALKRQFELLSAKLSAEGLFAAERKRRAADFAEAHRGDHLADRRRDSGHFARARHGALPRCQCSFTPWLCRATRPPARSPPRCSWPVCAATVMFIILGTRRRLTRRPVGLQR